jgi:hypothetical protein
LNIKHNAIKNSRVITSLPHACEVIYDNQCVVIYDTYYCQNWGA